MMPMTFLIAAGVQHYTAVVHKHSIAEVVMLPKPQCPLLLLRLVIVQLAPGPSCWQQDLLLQLFLL